MNATIDARVDRVDILTAGISLFTFVPAGPVAFPPVEAGAHVAIHLPSGLVRHYSLCNAPGETLRYVIAVQRDDRGRGGSMEVHARLRPGCTVQMDHPANFFPLTPDDQDVLLIGGGIGITPLVSMARQLFREGRGFRLLYLVRDEGSAAFSGILGQAAFADCVRIVTGDVAIGQAALAQELDAFTGRHIYCCGPAALMDHVAALTADGPHAAHFERFSAVPVARDDDDAFIVRLGHSGPSFKVDADRTILETLLHAGVDVPYSCGEGICGSCAIHYLRGEPDHRDFFMSESEREREIAICCSRSLGAEIVLDLSGG